MFKSLLKVKGGGTGEDKKTHVSTRIHGVRAEFAGPCSLPSMRRCFTSINPARSGGSDRVTAPEGWGSQGWSCGELQHLRQDPCVKMEELGSFQRRGCFLRKGGEEFRALEKPRPGARVQGAGTRCDPNASIFLLQREILSVNLSFIFGFPLDEVGAGRVRLCWTPDWC